MPFPKLPMAVDRVVGEMDDDRGWPLGEAQIRAKYHALVKRDLERKMLKAKVQKLPYDQMLQQIPVTLPKSRSTREAYSRARSLQRVLRRAGLTDTSGKGSRSVPVSSPSSLENQNSETPSREKNGVASPVDQENVLALAVDVAKPTVSASSGTRSRRLTCSEIHGKQTKFLAKQFTLISNTSTVPRRNIKILGKAASPSDEASFAACDAKVVLVAEKIERDQLQERIRLHDFDRSNSSSLKSVAGNLGVVNQSSSLRLDSLSRSSGPVMSRKKMTSPSGRYTDHAHANSPSSVISEVVSEGSIPETVLSSPENELTGRRSNLTSRKTSFSNTRQRWTSRELFGSFDFGGELDIDGTITKGKNGRYAKQDEIPNSESSSWSLDGSINSPSSGMRSPRQSSATSSQKGGTDHRHHNSGRVESHTRRIKVTSPSSLFRDGPWYNGDDYRKPCQEQSSPNIPRKLSRKLSTSFNKRRKQAMQVQPLPHPRDESQHASLSTRSPDKKVFNEKSVRNVTVGKKESFKENSTLEIAGLLSGFNQVKSRIYNGRVPGNARVSNGLILQQEATTAFQDDIAQLMLDRSESNEIGDIEEFLDGYMQLRSPFYLEVVEEFFRTVSYDCYKRPLDVKKQLPPKVPHR